MRHAVAVYKQTAWSAQQILDDLSRLKDIEKLDNFSKHELEAYQLQYKKESAQSKRSSNDIWVEKYGAIVFAVAGLCFVWGLISLLATGLNFLMDFFKWIF